MPRDHFYYSPDGELVMQAWVSILDGRDESDITDEERHYYLTPEQWERGLRVLRPWNAKKEKP